MYGIFSGCFLNLYFIYKKINVNNIFDKVNKYCKIIFNDEKIKQILLKKFE